MRAFPEIAGSESRRVSSAVKKVFSGTGGDTAVGTNVVVSLPNTMHVIFEFYAVT